MKNFLKVVFIILCIVFIIPSIIYLIKNGTVLGFKVYYNFFINEDFNKTISTIIYLIIFTGLIAIYFYFIKKKEIFKNIKQLLIYTGIASSIFIVMLPWTSSDIFYYMGVGELDSVYKQNPYYITMRDYGDQNQEILENDSIMKQGYNNYWAKTTVVYGPVTQAIFSILTRISFRNIDVCLIIFKLLNILVHLLNCYLIYKITKKLKFSIIYGLNPYILLEFIGQVHVDIIVVFLILLSLYFLLKKKKILPSVMFLAIATGMKYFTILLLPVIILYHFKAEEKIGKRFLKCIQYGLIFLAIFVSEYLIYFRDISIFTAMMAQTNRYCKSIYSGIHAWGVVNKKVLFVIFGNIYKIGDIAKFIRNIMFVVFVFCYVKFCLDLLFEKKIRLYKTLRKYSFCLLLFIIALSNFQQWYLIWLYATIPWQKSNRIRNIVGLSLATEFGNSIYMFKKESFRFDDEFVLIIAAIYIIWVLYTNTRFDENSRMICEKFKNKKEFLCNKIKRRKRLE